MNVRKIWPLSIIGIGAIITAWFVWHDTTYTHPHIKPYDAERDRAAILNLFEKDWQWLVAHFTPQEYSAAYRLDYKAPSKAPGDVNRMNIDVYRTDETTVGFVAYYMLNFHKGMILFLSVDREYRGQGIARALVSHAVEQLKDKGARVVQLITRVDNYAAQRVYEGFGFQRVHQDDMFFTYRYRLTDE